MNEEQIQRTIDFILQNQAESAVRNAAFEESLKKMEADHIALKEDIRDLMEVSRNLVRVAEIHSRRLDLIEGSQAS